MEKETSRIVIYVIIFVVIAIVNIVLKKKKANVNKNTAKGDTSKNIANAKSENLETQPIIVNEKKVIVKPSLLEDFLKNKSSVNKNIDNHKITKKIENTVYKSKTKTNETNEQKENSTFEQNELKKAIIYYEVFKPLDI